MLCLNPAGGDVSFQPYHDYSAMTSKLRQLNDAHPDLSYLYKLSATSVEGRQLWVLQLGSSAGTERGQLVPMVKFVANLHGNEVIGRELMLTLAEYLLDEYKVRAFTGYMLKRGLQVGRTLLLLLLTTSVSTFLKFSQSMDHLLVQPFLIFI